MDTPTTNTTIVSDDDRPASVEREAEVKNLREMPVIRLSICPCAEPVLKEHIGLGAIYRLDMASVRGGFSYKCGGCGKTIGEVTVVNASQSAEHGGRLAPLPLGLFQEVV